MLQRVDWRFGGTYCLLLQVQVIFFYFCILKIQAMESADGWMNELMGRWKRDRKKKRG
jgi:hypothetical protein